MLRIFPDGSLDTGFGTSGYFSLDPPGAESLTGVTLQADGQIVIGVEKRWGDGSLGLYRLYP